MTLEKIEALVGQVRAFDGRNCIWAATGVYDVRDIAKRLKATPDAIVEALPAFKPSKRGRVSQETEE